jgi:hypothetical protein
VNPGLEGCDGRLSPIGDGVAACGRNVAERKSAPRQKTDSLAMQLHLHSSLLPEALTALLRHAAITIDEAIR